MESIINKVYSRIADWHLFPLCNCLQKPLNPLNFFNYNSKDLLGYARNQRESQVLTLG